jgi:hypothetical protein
VERVITKRNGRTQTVPEKVMALVIARGYKVVILQRPGARISKRVHRAVLEAFVGSCPPRHEASHLDNDPFNNRLENLAWETAKENMARIKRRADYEQICRKISQARKAGWASLTPEQKAAHAERSRENVRAWRASMTSEQRAEHAQKISETLRAKHHNKKGV